MTGEMKSNKQKHGNPPAQALIELALVLPILLLLILGTMDLGRMFYAKMVLTNAAREGANYLAYFPEDADNAYVNTFAAIHDEADSSNVELVATDVTYSGCCIKGLPVEVTIIKTIDLIFDDFLKSLGLLGGPIQLTSAVKMMVQ
jgi:hypothetical protein